VALEEIDRILAELPPSDPAEPPYFLFLGRLHPKKGIHLLIQDGEKQGQKFIEARFGQRG